MTANKMNSHVQHLSEKCVTKDRSLSNFFVRKIVQKVERKKKKEGRKERERKGEKCGKKL